MLGFLLRLALFAAALVGVVLLFLYAAFVAVIFIPVVLLVLFLLRKNGAIRWTTMDLRGRREAPTRRAPPIIDHDPNDIATGRRPD